MIPPEVQNHRNSPHDDHRRASSNENPDQRGSDQAQNHGDEDNQANQSSNRYNHDDEGGAYEGDGDMMHNQDRNS